MSQWCFKEKIPLSKLEFIGFGVVLYIWVGFFLMIGFVGAEGRGYPEDHPVYELSSFLGGFFGTYPVWLILFVLCAFKRVGWIFVILIGLFGFALWSSSREIGHVLNLGNIQYGLVFLLSDWGGIYLICMMSTLIVYIAGSLFFPYVYRTCLLLSIGIVSIGGLVTIVTLNHMFPNFSVVQVSAKADPYTRSQAQYPVTPLMLAAGYGTAEEVQSQFAKGIDINAKNIYGTNALMYAALAGKSENIKLLLAAGARVDDQDDKGNTALSLARQQGHHEVIGLLIAAGANEILTPRIESNPR